MRLAVVDMANSRHSMATDPGGPWDGAEAVAAAARQRGGRQGGAVAGSIRSRREGQGRGQGAGGAAGKGRRVKGEAGVGEAQAAGGHRLEDGRSCLLFSLHLINKTGS